MVDKAARVLNEFVEQFGLVGKYEMTSAKYCLQTIQCSVSNTANNIAASVNVV
jgi:hypothetical protein